MSLDRKFNEDSKNVLKNMFRSLQMGFTCYFIPDCYFKFYKKNKYLNLNLMIKIKINILHPQSATKHVFSGLVGGLGG